MATADTLATWLDKHTHSHPPGS